MGRCKICGKPTLENYQYCPQCSSAQRESRPPERRGGGQYSGPPARRSGQERTVPGLGPDYLQGGYFNEKGYLRKEIFTTEAERVAGLLSAKGMTSAALRRFYNKVRGIYERYNDTKNFEEAKTGLYSIYPNVADKVSRNNSNVPEEFRRFINTNLNLAERDPDHLKGFVQHFQSVVAYFKDNTVRR